MESCPVESISHSRRGGSRAVINFPSDYSVTSLESINAIGSDSPDLRLYASTENGGV